LNQFAIVFLGAGEMQDELRRRAEGSPKVSVRFPGFQNQSRLSAYYHAADMLVLPSRCSETWGLVVNDALHHGLVCVVSDQVGCAPDLIEPGTTGEIFPSDSIPQLQTAILRALEYCRCAAARGECRRR